MPDTIAARTLLLLIVGLTLSHLLSVALYFTDRAAALSLTGGEHISERIVTVEGIINRAPSAERVDIASLADRQRLHVFWSKEPAVEDTPVNAWQARVLRDALARHFAEGEKRNYRLSYTDKVDGHEWNGHFKELHGGHSTQTMLLVSLKAQDEGWLNFAAPLEPREAFWTLKFVLSLLVMLLAVAMLSAIVVRRLTKPLVTLAGAAQRLGADLNAPPLPETGPSEVRSASRAFNEMQNRVRRLVEDRTRMVAAISHDLGTPITRLRLRAEFIENAEQQQKMLADLADMETMVKSVMSFVRDDFGGEMRSVVDLRSILRRICDEMADASESVEFSAKPTAIPFLCQPTAIRRAMTNIVSNAVRYGKRARISLKALKSGIEIQIDDDGPGIPEDAWEDVFKPFHRLDTSRSRDTGGVGLGLSVARSVIRAHGGEVSITNRKEGGLRVLVQLPVSGRSLETEEPTAAANPSPVS